MEKQLRDDDARWREVVLLTAAKANTGNNVWTLLSVFCPHDWPPPEPARDADWYAALRAAQALVETEQQDKAPERQKHLVRRVHQWLLQLVTLGVLPPRDRAEAGRLLNYLHDGDPRVEKDEWVEIPGGEFTMGTDEEEIARLVYTYDWAREWQNLDLFADECPRRVRLPEYKIGKYPVTNREYRRFIDAGGYELEGGRYWSLGGRNWKDKFEANEPGYWQDPQLNRANQPVVGVIWYEAEAYCSWLTEHLRATGELSQDQEIRLPWETEWEYAARGTTGWTWPWRNDWDPSRANTEEGGVGEPMAVGIYPNGASPYGVLDMAGNVFEWCENWYTPGRDKCLRGGSWYHGAGHARCASRRDGYPVYRSDDLGFRCVVVPQRSPKK